MSVLNRTAAPAAEARTPVAGAPAARRRWRAAHRSRTPKHLRSNLTGYLMIAPMVILLGIFVIWPLIYAFYLSTYQINFYQGSKFVGLKFYRYVLTDPDFWSSLEVGLKFAAMVVPAGMVLAVLLASIIKTLGRRS